MSKRFIAIGHITNDTEPIPHLGGGATYTAVAAKRLGLEAHIITKCPENHPYVSELRNFGVVVHVLQTKLMTISTHQNIYDKNGRKKQRIWDIQEFITAKDFEKFPKNILKDSDILITPVNAEVDIELPSILSRYGNVSVAPSGYFRMINKNRSVIHQMWTGYESTSNVNTLLLGDQDIAFDEKPDTFYLKKLINFFPVVVLTQAEKGSTVYLKGIGKKVFPFPLSVEMKNDFTGAGDSYTSAFLAKLAKTSNNQSAAVFATFFAAVKIAAVSGFGINSIPTLESIEQFSKDYPFEIKKFLKINNAKEEDLKL